MDSAPLSMAGGASQPQGFRFVDGDRTINVDKSREDIAAEIDINPKDGIIDDRELKDYLKKQDILRDPAKCNVDEEAVVSQYKDFLEARPMAEKEAYYSYDQVVDDMKALVQKYPDLCTMESLGKTAEGREVWAMKASTGAPGDTSGKPGVLFAARAHAREPIGTEVDMSLMKSMIEGAAGGDSAMKDRLEKNEIWFIPLQNPDGGEFARTENSFWRKNRNPVDPKGIETNGEGNVADRAGAIGVDLNRNFMHPEHPEWHRPAGDTPGSTYDDEGASDSPRSDQYRGKSGASEVEVKAEQDLVLGHPNIKGIIDFHSYGDMMLYPYGHNYDTAENLDMLQEVGKKMNQATGNKFRLMQSSDLYPCTGSSEDFHHAAKRLTFTIEIGSSFYPSEKQIEPICKNLIPALTTFIDYVNEHKDQIPWPDPKTAGYTISR